MSTDAAIVYPLAGKRVWVAGHRGMVGSALMRRLAHEQCELLTVGRAGLDLRRQADVEAWIAAAKPQAVFLAAATVGGILANDSRPAEFLYDNLAIETNVIEAARRAGVEKLLFLGSACIYPGLAPQPMAAFCIEHLFYDFDDQPISWGWFIGRADRLRFTTRVGLSVEQRPA